MRIAILGNNGYIGTALHKFLEDKGHEVFGVDSGLREQNVSSVGGQSITEKVTRDYEELDITNYPALCSFFDTTKPDVIVHLAEQPSAPFSMSSQKNSDQTISNNTRGTMNVLWAMKEVCPDAHLIKIGTEGEYPDWLWNGKHIPEGSKMEVYRLIANHTYGVPVLDDTGERTYHPEEWTIPTPRSFGSIYHSTKFYESHLIDYFCRVWGLTATDINQGIVYSHRNGTRLDADSSFGTVVHRFVAQAVAGLPLTVHGTGGQTRGFICLQNSLEAIGLLTENPPEQGEFRVIHQTTEEHTIKSIAEKVAQLTGADIEYIENPRAEMSENTFTFDTSTLDGLGLQKIALDDELPRLIETVRENSDRIIKETITNTTTWR